MKKVLILGGLGNASVIANAIIDANRRGANEYQFAGYINDRDNVEEIEGYPVKGGLKDIPRLIDEGYYFLNTIYKIDGQKLQPFDPPVGNYRIQPGYFNCLYALWPIY